MRKSRGSASLRGEKEREREREGEGEGERERRWEPCGRECEK